MQLPLTVDDPSDWVVTRDMESVTVALLTALAADFTQAATEPLRMALRVTVAPGREVGFRLPCAGFVKAAPIDVAGVHRGHRIIVREVPTLAGDDPHGVTVTCAFRWADGSATGNSLREAFRQRAIDGRMVWTGHPGSLGLDRAIAEIRAELEQLGITDYTDADYAPVPPDDWFTHKFALWWYNRSRIALEATPAAVDAAPLITLGPGDVAELTFTGRRLNQPVTTPPMLINPGLVLSRRLQGDDLERARSSGLVVADEPEWLVGHLPENAEDAGSWVVIGNDDQGWRLFLPTPELLPPLDPTIEPKNVHSGFSFTSFERLYLAHSEHGRATLRLTGAGMKEEEAVRAPAADAPEQEIVLNRDRPPTHPGFRTKEARRTAPLQLQIGVPAPGAPDRVLTLVQDEIDIIRQEYALHLNWKRALGEYYFQPGRDTNEERRAQWRASDADVQRVDAEENRLPHLRAPDGSVTPIPDRADLRVLQGDELADHERRVRNPNARPEYAYTLLHRDWTTWFKRLDEDYERIRASILHPAGPDPPPALIAFLAAEKLAGANLEDFVPDHLEINSAWRPPQHNEAVDGAYNSFHQSGLALDIRPFDADLAHRRPLALAILHEAAIAYLPPSVASVHLRTVILEDNSNAFVFARYRPEFRDWRVHVELEPASQPDRDPTWKMYLHPPAGLAVPRVEVTKSTTGFDNRLLDRIQSEIGSTGEPPRYIDVYWLAVWEGSHVHVDWVGG